MILDLTGTDSQTARRAFLDAFWREFGSKNNKYYKSTKSEQKTLDRLKLIGETVILININSKKNKVNRDKFNKVKSHRHSLKSHRLCFVCGAQATVRHHIIWIKHGGLNSKRNLVSLCDNCHAYIHPWLAKN